MEGFVPASHQSNECVLFQGDGCASSSIEDAPANFGRLGEEYAAEWLKRQSWVDSESVSWFNKEMESGNSFDITCKSRGRELCVEVKTRWKGFGRLCLSESQRDRFASGDLMILVIGHFGKYFGNPGIAPIVRCINPAKEEDKEWTARFKIDMKPWMSKEIDQVQKDTQSSIYFMLSETVIKGKTLKEVTEAQRRMEELISAK